MTNFDEIVSGLDTADETATTATAALAHLRLQQAKMWLFWRMTFAVLLIPIWAVAWVAAFRYVF